MIKRATTTREAAEALAIQALTFIAGDGDRLGRFLALSGCGPDSIRSAAQNPEFLGGVLEHVTADEELLVAFAQDAQVTPMTVEKARVILAGNAWERDVP